MLGQLVMAARGQKDAFTITGTDNPTRDGTGIRDYIHVWDLARAHVRAIERFDEVLAAAGEPSVVINIGTGAGVTVRELIVAVREGLRQRGPDPRGAVAARRRARRLRQRRPRATSCSAGTTSSRSRRPSPRRWPGASKRQEILGYE